MQQGTDFACLLKRREEDTKERKHSGRGAPCFNRNEKDS
jgi:hypothetical protein